MVGIRRERESSPAVGAYPIPLVHSNVFRHFVDGHTPLIPNLTYEEKYQTVLIKGMENFIKMADEEWKLAINCSTLASFTGGVVIPSYILGAWQ